MSPRLERANFLYDQGRTIEAEVELRAALSEGDDTSYVHALLGLCLLKAGLIDDARLELEAALARDPNSAYNHYAISFVHEAANTRTGLFGGSRTGSSSEVGRRCMESALRAVELEPETPRYLIRLAEIFQDQERWDESISPAEAALRLSPGDCFAAVKLAEALTRLHRAGEARAVLRRALEMNPAKSLAHAGMGWALLRAGDYQRAEQFFQAALRMHADSAWAQQGALECAKHQYRLHRWLWRFSWWFRNLDAFVAGLVVIALIAGLGGLLAAYFTWVYPLLRRYLGNGGFALLTLVLVSGACITFFFHNEIFLWFVRRHVAAQTSLGTQRRRFAVRAALVLAIGVGLVPLSLFLERFSNRAPDLIFGILPAAFAFNSIFKTFPAGQRRWFWMAYVLIVFALTSLFILGTPQSLDPGPDAGFVIALVLPYVPLFIACDAEKKKALERKHASDVANASRANDF